MCSFTFPPTMLKCSIFLTYLPAVTFCLFHSNYSNWSEVIFLCGFELHDLDGWWCRLLLCPFDRLCIFFWKISSQIICSFLNQNIFFLLSFLYLSVFWMQSLLTWIFSKYFAPFCMFSLPSFDCVFGYAEPF